MKAFRGVALITGILALSGCTAFNSFSEVDALNEAQPIGSPFTQALANEYRDFANKELDEMFDYPDALHFARKGLAAASGETVMPEPIGDWNLSENHMRELGAARGRLIVAYDLGAREADPALAANAQARFDCWIEYQEENWKSDSGVCKTQFLDAIQRLEAGLTPPAPQQVEAVDQDFGVYDIDPAEPMAVENAMYLVFFNWDSHDLGTASMNVLEAVGDEVGQVAPSTVNVIGHSDTSGPKDYNQKLALRRANAVKDALVKRGVDASLIAVDAKGETELLVPTSDEVREPANRRVNISFE